MSEMTQADRAALAALIARARAERKWLYCGSMLVGPLWFTPDELAAENANGKFVWGVVNWRLREPHEFIDEVCERLKAAQEAYVAAGMRYDRWKNGAPP